MFICEKIDGSHPATEMSCWIVSSSREELDTDLSAEPLVVGIRHIAVGKNCKGKLLTQVRNQPHNRSLSYNYDLHSDRQGQSLAQWNLANEVAFNKVIRFLERQQIFTAAAKN